MANHDYQCQGRQNTISQNIYFERKICPLTGGFSNLLVNALVISIQFSLLNAFPQERIKL